MTPNLRIIQDSRFRNASFPLFREGLEDGTLNETNPPGKYTQVGQKGGYAEMTNLAALNNYLYTVERGTLYRTK